MSRREALDEHVRPFDEVSHNVSGASHAADQSRALADNVMVASGELGQHAAPLFRSVDTFLAGLRNAA